MRIINYYNLIMTFAYGFIALLSIFLCLTKSQKASKNSYSGALSSQSTAFIFILIMIIAAVSRLFLLDKLPDGLQQDEASIGYDAFCLANYGIDRNGYHWPIYPITWGCGGGSPLLIYLNVIVIKLFGTGIVGLRLIPAVCGVLTVLLFFLTLRLVFEKSRFMNELSLFGAFFLAICPWHIIQSRWSLDANIMPFNLMLAVYLFVLGAKQRSTLIYCLSSAGFAICMYSYGAATVVIPIFLLLICAYCLATHQINWPQVRKAVITFIIVFAPLLWFYLVNYVGLPEVVTQHFSVNKFTAARSGEAFITLDGDLPSKLLGNLKTMLREISIGNEDTLSVFYYPGYSTLYAFTWPLTLLGFIISIIELFNAKKRNIGNAVFLFLTLASAILCLIIIPDTSRMVMMFIPFIFFFVKGVGFVLENSKKLFIAITATLLIAAISFGKDYYTDFNNWSTDAFMPGYGNAINRAYEIAGDERPIISTYEGLSAPFMLALYYTDYDPNKFYTTVVYKDPLAEFRVAQSFGNFTFGLPEDYTSDKYAGDVFVLASSEIAPFENNSNYTLEQYEGYWVVY